MAQDSRKVSTLAAALDAWEDWWFCLNLLNRRAFSIQGQYVYAPERAMLNYERLRSFFLSLHGMAYTPNAVSVNDFLAPTDMVAAADSVLLGLPVTLGSFTLHSRREYGLSTDLQAILGATSLKHVTWEDVNLPHGSFAISLATPFRDAEGAEYDFLLVTTSEGSTGKRTLTFQAWQSSARGYVALTPKDKQVLLARAARRDWKLMNTTVQNRMDLITEKVDAFGIKLESGESLGNEFVISTARRDFEAKHAGQERGYTWQDTDRIIRLVVGFCLYLDSLPPGSPHLSDPNRVPLRSGARDRRAITNELEICNVRSSFQLTREDRIGLGLESPPAGERVPYELSWGFRRGYNRRPAGLGDNPDAERTVRVKGYIVRADRAENPGAPGGAFATV